MKMILGAGTIANYMSYISNCKLGQWPYRIPVAQLSDVQLYIDTGSSIKPSTVHYQLIHTCSPNQGQVDTIATVNFIVGQQKNFKWYGVFRNFTGSTPSCFVIAITLDSQIYFSEEYCIDPCAQLTFLQGCYGHLDNLISNDCQGIYFGTHDGPDPAMGDDLMYYKHQLYLRSVEVSLSAIKNTFKQGRTRNFRTEKEKIYQFYGEFIPEWYLPEIDAVFNRGEVYVGATKYLVNETSFEKIEDCKRAWKPTATFKDSCYQSFSCEDSPCDALPPAPCCDPVGVSARTQGGVCCDPEIISVEVFVPSG